DKGLDRFIALAHRLPQFSWHCFGQGPAQSLLTSSAVQNHRFYEDIQLIWPQIDLLVIPSRYEGLPMVALEALAAGIPVIGYDVGDLATILDDKVGALVTRNHQTALAQAILTVATYSDEQLQQLSQQAKTRIQNEWHGQETIALCMAYYQQCRQP
ncbi:MAG: glycosyltransferase, partial [Ferrimonas sp.]